MTVTTIEKVIENTAEAIFEKYYNLLQEQQREYGIKLIRVFTEQEKERKKKLYLRNTKLLLKHYPEFEAHIRGSISCKKELLESEFVSELTEEEFDELLISAVDEDVYISSIQRTKSRTMLLLNNIDAQLAQLKKICMKKGNIHKYQMLVDYYVNGFTQEVIAEKYGCYVTQVSTWINEMVQALSRLLFGIDCIQDLI
jgi:hypothetical protein